MHVVLTGRLSLLFVWNLVFVLVKCVLLLICFCWNFSITDTKIYCEYMEKHFGDLLEFKSLRRGGATF